MQTQEIKEKIIAVLREIYDPEIPVNIYDLGLIYDIDVKPCGGVRITMTLTAPTCPMAEQLVAEVERKVAEIEGVRKVRVKLTFDPPWDKSRISEETLLELGLL